MLRISSLPLSVSFTPSLYHHHLPALHLILCQCAPPPSRPPFLTRPPLCSPRLSSVHFAILFLSPSRHFKVGVIRAPSINVFIFFLLKKKKDAFPSRPLLDSRDRLFGKLERLHWPCNFLMPSYQQLKAP